MTAVVSHRSCTPSGRRGGIAARRAVIRWSWRLFRREWRQQALILALIATAVGAAVVGAAIASSTPRSASGTFGTANHLVTIPGGDPHLAADIAAIGARFGPVEVVESSTLSTGSAAGAQVLAEDPDGRYTKSMLVLLSGRYPVGPREIALTPQLAARYGLGVGRTWAGAPGGPSRVVGIVENPQNLLGTFALVAPGQLRDPAEVTVLFDGAAAQVRQYPFPRGALVERRPPPAGLLSGQAIVLVMAVLGLVFVGLVSSAGFSVMAHRRLRALGMVESLGATDRDVRLVTMAGGGVVGLAGTGAGAAAGFAFWFAYAPHLQSSANHVIDAYDLPWWLIGASMGLAVLTAVLAALGPARAAARVPVVAALSGRPPAPTPSHRSAVPGVAVLAAGLAFLAASGPGGSRPAGGTALLALGVLATVAGGLLLSPLAIAALAKAGARAPVAVRIALRDLHRYRARSAAALGAASLAVTIATLVCTVASTRSANVLDYVGPNLASDQMIVNARGSAAGPRLKPGSGRAPAPPQLSEAQMQVRARVIAATVGAASVLGLVDSGATLFRTTDPNFQNFTGTLYVATPALLRYFGIRASDVGAGVDVLSSRHGLGSVADLVLRVRQGPSASHEAVVRASTGCPQASCIAHPVIEETDRLPTGTSAPNVVITEQALARLGLTVGEPDAWMIAARHSISADERYTAQALAAAAGMTVATKSSQPSLRSLEYWSAAAGIAIALGVLAMTAGLIRSEAAGDLRTLTATGAGTRVRRAVTSTTTGGLGLLGGVLGTAVGLAGVASFYRHHLDQVSSRFPVADLLVLAVGLPLAAALGGWIFAGREPPAIARRPLE